MKQVLLFFAIAFLGFSNNAFSQMQQMMQKGMTAGRVYGKVVDSKTNKPVEFAAVQISNFKKDST